MGKAMRWVIVALCGIWASAQTFAVPITEISFAGNKKTEDSVLRQELLLHEGDELDPERVEASRQAIMNLGLFKTVESSLEPDGEGQRLVFRVEERFYFLPIPRLNGDYDEKNYSYGLEVRHDNVMGLNQRLKLVYEKVESLESDVPSRREVKMEYSVPRVIGTPYQLSLNAKQVSEDILEKDATDGLVTGSYSRDINSGGIFFSRWLEADWISQGWTVGAGVSFVGMDFKQQIGTALAYRDSQAITLNVGLNYHQVEEHQYHRAGSSYGYSLGVASPPLGSDYAYTAHWLHYRSYYPLQSWSANFNTRFRMGLSNGSAFDAPSYSIGNSSLLRGYENDYAAGNAMMLLNMEYHHPLSGYKQLRGVVFADVGNAWERPADMDLSEMLFGLGLGLRWRVQSFVDLTLRIDYGYGVEAGTEQTSLSSKGSF